MEGKVAIVTGAGSSGPGVGTGKATATLFAREGAKVLCVDRVASQAEATLATIREEGGEASVFEADVTVAENCRAMVDTAVERYGGLHILFNNVGIDAQDNAVVDVKEEEWDRVLDTNLKSMMLTSKFAVPRMAEGGGGAIINVSSVAGIRGGNISYSASKGGVIALSPILTTAMAVHHGRSNIRVNCIAPGSIYTPMVSPMSDETRDLRRRAGALGTEGTAWDVAWAVVFLASDEARWISGVVLPVDAGVLATSPLSMLEYLEISDS